MRVTSSRLFIADFDLVGYSGHYFNHVFGFREAANAQRIATKIYISRRAEPAIAAELNAHPILSPLPWHMTREALSSGFVNVRRLLGPLLEDIEKENISSQDILLITSARPQVILGVAQWLGTRPESMRPAVFFRFSRTNFFDFRRMEFSDVAWIYEFVARMLTAMPGGDRIFLTVNNEKAVPHLEQLTLRSTFFLPIPQYYGAVANQSEPRTGGSARIYVHVNRQGSMPELVAQALSIILRRRSDVTFAIRFCAYMFPTNEAQEAVAKAFLGLDIEILPGAQGPDEYLAAIEQADMVLLPYDPVEYHDVTSAIFCETAAVGRAAIVPAQTWMADHIVGGRATGVMFDSNNVDEVVAAIECALEDRARLQAEAFDRGIRFREQYSAARNLDGMLELAKQFHDMRLPYVPLAHTTKLFDSQLYLGEGWHPPEGEWGSWSDGDRAEFNFTIRPAAKALFFNAQVYPFLAPNHSRIDVSLSANDVPVGEWSFDAARPDDLAWSWRHVQLPESVTVSGKIQIVLSIRSPASPKELGLSTDPRKLGIALRQFSLNPEKTVMQSYVAESLEKPSEPGSSSEKLSRFSQWRGWLRRKRR